MKRWNIYAQRWKDTLWNVIEILKCFMLNVNTYNAGVSRRHDQNITNLVKKCQYSGIRLLYLH